MTLKEILEEVEDRLNINCMEGVVVIKKSQADERKSEELFDKLNCCVEEIGYETLVYDNNKNHYISYIVKPFST